jgi:hypothetical protein
VEKLQARCRQLHHLIFSDDVLAGRVRSQFLLPLCQSDGDFHDGVVNVISLGGGPGYDHVALCLAAKFLCDIQPLRNMLETRVIRTRVYDLFDDDWAPVMAALAECCHQGLLADTHGSEDGSCRSNDNCNNGSNMTMHHADLRLGLDETPHTDLKHAVESAHIICAQFVLHENSSFILEDKEINGKQQQRIGGTMKDIFAQASLGTIMICTDSANTLFPPLKETAKEYGWIYFGDEEQREKREKLTYLGPKSYVILERIKNV